MALLKKIFLEVKIKDMFKSMKEWEDHQAMHLKPGFYFYPLTNRLSQ